ncbi:NAD(P)-binding protein [Daedaleopsis nitida]|nr:NAD(P)-binding protein [Daedaleopsis nitida]
MPPSRVWLVTGASSGFGLEMTRCALESGDRVVATLRTPSALAAFAAKYSATQLALVQLDVTDAAAVKAAFAQAKAAFGRVDVVFNNAGYVLAGEAETMPEALARALFEVDFWGAVRVSQEAVRFFREENRPQGGHLVQNSAAVGLVGFPVLGFYGAAKHALEGFTDALSKELDPAWDIKITSVEPGAFKTEITHALQFAPQHPAYANPTSLTSIVRKSLSDDGPKEGDAASRYGWNDTRKGVQKIFELTLLPNPPARFPLGQDSIRFCRDYVDEISRDVEGYAHWSDELAYEG